MGTVPPDLFPTKPSGEVYCANCSSFKSAGVFHECTSGRNRCEDFSVEGKINLPYYPKVSAPTGGPSKYYDMPFKDWITTNDMMEYLAEHKWGKFGIHLKDIFKGICRWGDKEGTSVEYDAKKIIYYGVRILQLVAGRTEMRAYLREILHDPQFKAIEPESASKH